MNTFDQELDKLLGGLGMSKDTVTIPENRHRLITQFATLWWKRLETHKPLSVKEFLELQNFFLYLERVMKEIPMSPAVPPMAAMAGTLQHKKEDPHEPS